MVHIDQNRAIATVVYTISKKCCGELTPIGVLARGTIFGTHVCNLVHPKLRNVNFHNVTYSLISQNPRKRMFVVQISLVIVTFLSLISQNLSLMQTTKEVNPHPRIAPCVNM